QAAIRREVAATRRPWLSAPSTSDDSELARWLGSPPRAVLPLTAGDRLVALLLIAGPASCGTAPSPAFQQAAALALRNARLHAESLRALAEPLPTPSGPAETTPTPLADMASLLAVALGRLATARERVTDSATTQDLADAEEATWRAAEAVRRVLGFAPGSGAPPAVPVDLVPLVRDAVQSTEALWARQGWGPAVALDLEPTPPVRVHPDELRQVLRHLLDNAREATPERSDDPITVRLRWDGGNRAE